MKKITKAVIPAKLSCRQPGGSRGPSLDKNKLYPCSTDGRRAGLRHAGMTAFFAGVTLLFAALSTRAFTLDSIGKIAATDGSAADVQAAINNASVVDGWTVSIPQGTFHWSTTVSVAGKGIHIKGSGGTGLVGRSLTSLTIGTGSKTVVTQNGLPIQAGQVLRLIYPANGSKFMEGVVTAYSGTSLTVNITATGGAGTYGLWTVALQTKTMLINDVPPALQPNGTYSGWWTTMIALYEDTTHKVELSGIHFKGGTAETRTTDEERGINHLKMFETIGGQPILVHENQFSASGSMGRSIGVHTNRGVVFRNSFENGFCASSYAGCSPQITQGLVFVLDDKDSSWSSESSLGTADTGGINNFYLEDNLFVGIWQSALDADSNSRSVVRYNTFDNTAIGTHGAETSPDGVRHYEIYNNTFYFDNLGNDTFQLNWWFYDRGGTGVIFNNVMPDINSSAWSNKNEIVLTQQSLRRNVAPPWGCWNAGWPHPRQVGQSWSGGGYATDPLYIWNNTGNPAVVASDYSPNECGDTAPLITEYIHIGNSVPTTQTASNHTDAVVGVAKPGYAPYTYPHPSRTGITPPSIGTPHPADTNTDYLISLNEATTFGACWKTSCNANATLDNASRAGFLWKGTATGAYQYNSAATCPLCWEVKL